MDDFDYSVHISERDWDCFFQECEECDLLPPVLAGLDDSGMSDIDDLNCHLSHRTPRQGRDAAGHPDRDLTDELPDCEGSPVEMYLDRYGLCSPDYVLSGSEDDFHIESVNRFFEQLRNVTTAEQSTGNHHTEKGNVTRAQENLCSNGIDDDYYPSLSHMHKGPHGVKTDQGAFGSNDVEPKSKKDPQHLDECTGIQSKPATDWYTRSKELAIAKEEQPLNPLKSHAWKEYDRRDPPYNNFTTELKVQPVQMGSSDTAVPLSSDLATCRNGIEGTRGDDVYGQPVLRRNAEQREPLAGQTLSPSSAMRRKKRRKKRLSIEPVDAGHMYEGQLQGRYSESDEDRHARRAEIDREARLSGDFGTVKMADKSNNPLPLSLRSVIDSLSDHLPGQANARTWKGSIPVPRELSAAGNQADGVDLPKAPPGACHSETSKMEGGRPDGRCYEKPLSPVQLVVENRCKSDETPLSANVNKQMKFSTLPFSNSGSSGAESQSVKVSGNLQRIITSALDAQKPDQVPVSPAPVDILGSSTENGLKIAHSPLEAESKTDLPLPLNGVTDAKGFSHSSVSLTHINSSALDSEKTLPLNYSAIIAISQNGAGPKHVNKMDDFKKTQDSFPDLDSKRIEKLKNQQGPTSDKHDSFDCSELSTDGTAASDGYSIKNANTLKCVQPEKIPCKPTNKDSRARSDTVSPVMSLDVQGVQAETSLLDNNNKPHAPPAHFNGPVTAECPAARGKATSDKQMQMKKESAEKTDQRPDKTQSKQIITYPAETDPKDPTHQNNSLTKGTSPEEHGTHQIYSDKQSERSSQLTVKTDSNVSSDNKSLFELSKVIGAERNVLPNSSTDAESNTNSDTHKEMMIATKECNETGKSEIQKYPANSNAVVKEPCKAISVKSTPNREVSRPNVDEDPNPCHAPLPEEASEADISEKNHQTVSNDPPPVFAMSSFWNEMEKLTINDILRLRLVSQAQHPSILDDGSFADTSHARDSGYFTHVDDSRPDRSSGDVSTMSDFDEESPASPLQDVPKEEGGGDEALANPSDVLWVGDPDPEASTEADDVVLISTETTIPQSRFAEQQYFRKMCKNISVQNLRALENQPLRQMLRNASVQSLRSLDDEEVPDPFYHINTSAQFSDDESVVDGHSYSLSEIIEYLFCDDDAKSTVSETENFITPHIDGTSVPENYDHFFSEFEAANLFFPEESSDSDATEMMPIFSSSRTSNRTLQFPELYDHLFPDSPTQSDEDEEREHSPPIRVVSRYDHQGANLLNSIKTASDSKSTVFWTSPLSLRKVRRTSLVIPSYQANTWLLAPDNNTKKTGIRTIQPINVMGYEDQGSFPDPLLCDLESRIFRKLAEQKMRCPELQTAVVDPSKDNYF